MKFLKFEFPDAVWTALKPQLETTVESPEGEETSWNPAIVTALVELGHICREWTTDVEGNPVCSVSSPNYAVDILWTDEPLADFVQYIVWPAPVGVHVFAGWEQAYATEYCIANPTAEYCQPPVPPTKGLV